MFVSLAGLCFLPLQTICLVCKYFKLSVNQAFTCQFLIFNILVNMLHPSSLFVCYICLCFVKCVNKLRLWYEGAPKYLGERVTDTEFGLRKRWRGLDAFIVIRDSGMDTGRCADELQCFWCACTVVFLLEDQSRWSWHHQMMSQGSLMLLWEGTTKGEQTGTSRLSSESSDTEHLGLLTSHRPSTLAISVPLVEQIITKMNCVFCLSICMYPDFSGELLVTVTLVVWR